MFKQTPPYQIIALVGSLLLVAFVLWAYNFSGGFIPDWSFNAAIFLSALVTVMTLLGLWQLLSDYRKGYLFPLRNATLFITLLTLVAIPVVLVWEAIEPDTIQPGTLLLLPVFLFMVSRNIFRIKIDEVALEAKLGFGRSHYIPLFNITNIREDDNSITVSHSGGTDIRLLRIFFFAQSWARMRERLLNHRS
ncbi:MAG: hypothetical protein AAF597_06895 [Bacteroidota bacterium]